MAKVPHDTDTCKKCLCPSCPVQAMSNCIMEKRPAWQKMRIDMKKMEMGPMEGSEHMMGHMMGHMGGEMHGEMTKMTHEEEMIGLYCSSEIGKSKCGDLDPSQMCTCPACDVWAEYGLKSQYYCTEGDADQRG